MPPEKLSERARERVAQRLDPFAMQTSAYDRAYLHALGQVLDEYQTETENRLAKLEAAANRSGQTSDPMSGYAVVPEVSGTVSGNNPVMGDKK